MQCAGGRGGLGGAQQHSSVALAPFIIIIIIHRRLGIPSSHVRARFVGASRGGPIFCVSSCALCWTCCHVFELVAACAARLCFGAVVGPP